MATKNIDDLDSRIKPLFFELIARAAVAGYPLFIVDIMRTVEEQKQHLADGTSHTMHSYHLPQEPEGKSCAFDVVPYVIYQSKGPCKLDWDVSHPAFPLIADIGRKLGLICGYDYPGHWDGGHFNLNVPFAPYNPPPQDNG